MNDLPKTFSEARALGTKYYMTGKPCRFGNIAPRLTSAGTCRCVDCKKVYSKKAYENAKKNPERTKATACAYREKNRLYQIAYRRDYKDRVRSADRTRHLLKAYGMTVEQYDRAFVDQGERCLICSKHPSETKRKRLCVDHCHESGRVRGLICDECNRALGVIEKYRDSINEMLFYADNSILHGMES